jgi:hypothetical protein
MRRRVLPTIESKPIPAPMGGINAVDPLTAMPVTDARSLVNLVAKQSGLQTRTGSEEWCTGLTGASDNMVRTTMTFTGNSSTKVFGCTSKGIYDVTDSSTAPSRLVTFGTQTGDAGWGVWWVATTPAGRYLVYCDEENGLYYWSESGSAWVQPVSGVTQAWAAQTAYAVGNQVVLGGNTYVCTTAGTSGTTGPTGTGTGKTDGTVVWTGSAGVTANAIGPSLADQNLGYTANPANFVAGCNWKGRPFLVERGTSRAWYLDTNALFGTATSFDFGSRMRAGGPLRGLWNWSYDGGSGIDTLLVGISGAGDVVIYEGVNPNSANTFELKGCWSLGAVPYGRRIATDFGGELLALSMLGVVPLSKLVLGDSSLDLKQYATSKVGPLFAALAASVGSLPGWALDIHPADNALLVLVPTAAGANTTQLAMSFQTKGWSQYADLPMLSGAVLNGDFYFGSADGRVLKSTGAVDGVTLANPGAYSPIQCSGLTASQNLGNTRNKQIQMVRPVVLSGLASPYVEVVAKYGLDSTAIPQPSTPGTSGAGWDSGLWDLAVWGGDSSPSQILSGTTGMGRDAALAFRFAATTPTTLVGFDVLFTQGGLL